MAGLDDAPGGRATTRPDGERRWSEQEPKGSAGHGASSGVGPDDISLSVDVDVMARDAAANHDPAVPVNLDIGCVGHPVGRGIAIVRVCECPLRAVDAGEPGCPDVQRFSGPSARMARSRFAGVEMPPVVLRSMVMLDLLAFVGRGADAPGPGGASARC